MRQLMLLLLLLLLLLWWWWLLLLLRARDRREAPVHSVCPVLGTWWSLIRGTAGGCVRRYGRRVGVESGLEVVSIVHV